MTTATDGTVLDAVFAMDAYEHDPDSGFWSKDLAEFFPDLEATQSLTESCGIPSPRSSEAIARLMPATCHSLISRYSVIASAARNERVRPVLLANRSSRFFTPVPMRTVNVVESMKSGPV